MAKRQYRLVLLLVATFHFSHAQTGINTPWYWMHGDYISNQPGIYATNPQHPLLMPGARTMPASWSTNNGNLWLYGGDGYDMNANRGYLSDLWKYSGTQWVFVKGDVVRDAAAVYGSIGVAANSNNPGARMGSVSWTDLNGDLWLFGGVAPSPVIWQYKNDLWKYSSTTNQWTWIHGDSASNQGAVFGVQGTSSPNNKPSARNNCTRWIDYGGNFWMLGGNGPDEAIWNDLWKYNPTINEWTWMKGDQVFYVAGVYGTMGISSTANKPGSRSGGASWLDANNKLWLYGGSGIGENLNSGGGRLSDLWKYDPVTNEWTWVNGDKTLNQLTSYGQQGITSSSNSPGAKTNCYSWTDAFGNLWLFGGAGTGANQGSLGNFNSLWEFVPSVNQWTWMKGDPLPDQPGLYNVGGVPGFVNSPGSRSGGASWTTNGSFWMLGGQGNAMSSSWGLMNDLWTISSSRLVILPLTLLDFAGTFRGDNVTLTWKITDQKGFSHFVLQRSSDGSRFEDLAKIYGNNRQDITVGSYEYIDSNVVFSNSCKLFYRLKIVDRDAGWSLGRVIYVSDKTKQFDIVLYPNPVTQMLHVYIDAPKRQKIQLQVLNENGQLMKQMDVNVVDGRNVFEIYVGHLQASPYILRLRSSQEIVEKRFMRQ